MPFQTGQYVGEGNRRSAKLSLDPVLELKHVIGYSPNKEKGLNVKWSRIPGENIVIFSSGGTIIAMDTETSEQKRFFFGHSAPVCCFDVAKQGNLIASAQDGKQTILRIWDYFTARCITMMSMPVVELKCLTFSPDGRFLCSVGKEEVRWWKGSDKYTVIEDGKPVEKERKPEIRELIFVWDLSKLAEGEQPTLLARQTSEFNI